MSFFNDFLDCLNIKELTNEVAISLVVGKGISVVGDFKIDILEENEISLKIKKEKIFIYGENLSIKSLAKGEIVILGAVSKVFVGEK